MTIISDFTNKKEYRTYAKELRAGLDMVKISYFICENIKEQDFYINSKNILGFYPFNSEADLTELYKDDSKNWFLPSINPSKKEMFIHPYKYYDILIENKFRVPEPITPHEENLEIIDMIIVPALMADKSGHRLGYGAGYYDRFLSKIKHSCIKVVPLPEELFVDALPYDELDVPADIILSEKGILSSLL